MTDNNGQDMNIDKSDGSQFGNFFDSKPESGNFGVNLESFEKDRKLREELRASIEREREERELREQEESRQRAKFYKEQREKKKARNKKIALIGSLLGIVLLIVIGGGIFGISQMVLGGKYDNAVACYEAGDYKEAYDTFASLKNFRDSKEQAKDSLYNYGKVLLEEGDFDEAKTAFKTNSDYKDSEDMMVLCDNEKAYKKALELLAESRYVLAIAAFNDLNGFRDSEDKAKEANYRYALKLYDYEEYVEASEIFESLKDYADSSEYFEKSLYDHAQSRMKLGEYKGAYEYFNKVSKNYLDTAEMIETSGYHYVQNLISEGDYDTAKEVLATLDPERCEDLYAQLYAWRVEMIINTSEDDLVTDEYSMSKYDTWYIHFKLLGGPPDGSTELSLKVISPEKEMKKYSFNDGPFKSGYEDTMGFSYKSPLFGDSGEMKFYFYDGDGNRIGEDSVLINPGKK